MSESKSQKLSEMHITNRAGGFTLIILRDFKISEKATVK